MTLILKLNGYLGQQKCR